MRALAGLGGFAGGDGRPTKITRELPWAGSESVGCRFGWSRAAEAVLLGAGCLGAALGGGDDDPVKPRHVEGRKEGGEML